MWPEVLVAKNEKRHELVLTGTAVDEHIQETEGLDEEIFKLQDLNFLKISSTCLVNISTNIKNLENLTNLVLQNNKIEELPSEIGELKKLKLLDVSQNKLTSLPSLDSLTSLATLNASNNNLSSTINLENCILLAHLDLRNNALDIFPDIFSEDLSLLADVYLSNNKLSEIPEIISFLSSLKLLHVENNCIKEVPGEITECTKLKELHLKGNPLTDKRFKKLVENDRTLPRQVLDYVRQHSSKKGGASSKGKKGKKGKERKNEVVEELNDLSNQLHILKVTDTSPEVMTASEVKDIRPYIVCCVVRSLDLSGAKFKQFLTVQTQLHETLCEKRCAATIATHDLSKIGTKLQYVVMPPEVMRIKPLGYAKELFARDFVLKLQKDADNQRKQQKRNSVSGIHKYLHLLDEKKLWSFLVDSDNTVLSMHPITNADKSKISPETTGILIEVTSSSSLAKAKEVMEKLILSIIELNATSEHTNNDQKIIKIQQTRVLNEDGSLRVLFPSRTDFNLNSSQIQVVFVDKDEGS